MGKLTLATPVTKVPLVGPSSARKLEKLNILTIRDLLYHIPSRYDDLSLTSKISSLQEGETVTVSGKIDSIKNQFTRRNFFLQKAQVSDETGTLDILWFNQPYLTRTLKRGDHVNLSGKIKRNGRHLEMQSPDYEILRDQNLPLHTGRIVGVYPETAGITSKWLRSRINLLLQSIENGSLELTDYLDEKTRSENNLKELKKALFSVHFPQKLEEAEKGRNRLAFDELLFSHLEWQNRKKQRQQKTVGNKFKIVDHRERLTTFVQSLPFQLTSAQKRVINDIYKDLSKDTPMNRLLQGDVGSGKTVVAALAMLAAYLNGYQTVIMAPTEILTFQHYETLNSLLKPLKIKVGIATSSKKDYQGFDIVVGTHALLSDQLNFKKLGLIVIDEQHRFGVSQRAKLAEKGINPHVLTMTATPIPRTVALTLYGDLDISILDELPKNRLPVKTWVVPPFKRDSAYRWIEKQKTQTFIICPLIEESESETLAEVKAAKVEFDRLKKDVFPNLKLGLLHGKLKPNEKESVLNDFRSQKLDILVATPVVEVGIDISSATIMLIEAADRFGLAQLHQLRGRVGRGEKKSYCLLFSQSQSTIGRLKYLENLNSGLELAEIDLKFRGPGQRFGTAQHGKWDLKIADFTNLELVERSNTLAQKILANPDRFPLLHQLIAEGKINIVAN